MSRPASPTPARSGIDTPAVVRERLERDARSAAVDDALSPERGLAAPAPGRPLATPSGGRAEDATLVPGVGREMGGLRLHDDEAAARQADELGARAFAYGEHVVLGRGVRPGTPEGDRVLAHEVAHTAQQALPGAGAMVQRDDGDGQGIGRRPPTDDFVDMPGETGVEDDHVLFQRDAATLDEADEATIRALVQPYTEAVTVHVHGYTSEEGGPEYNMNLSAHRAVAVKRFLEGLLPEGSRVVLYAHGEVGDFGPRAENRRVGIDVIEQSLSSGLMGGGLTRPTLPGSGFSLGVDLDLGPLPDLGDLTLDTSEIGSTTDFTIDPSFPPPEPNYFAEVPSLVPSYNLGGPAAGYALRGVPYTDRDARSYQAHYDFWVHKYVRWGLSPERAAWLAQMGTDVAASNQLSVEFPTQFEEQDRRFGTEPTVVPVFNDAMMRWLFERFQD